jgi:oxygen-independent coproporphyrinogen-3 oxidase
MLQVLNSSPPGSASPQSRIAHQTALNPADLPPAEIDALYVHVPFCFHKCHYCDFYSITRQEPARMERFVELIVREAQWWVRQRHLRLRPRTIFFGGGTPTLLPIAAMRDLLSALRGLLDCSLLNEWTVEANPATVTAEYCQMLRSEGVDRISFGAQSFNAAELKVLERHHDPEDVPRSVELARAAGFSRINVDLIYAIPGQTSESWAQTLDRAIALRTPHLSCYNLTFEANTPIAVKQRLGLIHQAEESVELQMLLHTRNRLAQAGLPAYEISNHAVEGEACRHNLCYWTGGNYIGLGPSAASHVGPREANGANSRAWRWKNRPHLGEWEQAVAADTLPAAEVESLGAAQRAGELAMLLLRLTCGLEYSDFADRTGFDARAIYSDPIARFTRAGLLESDETGVRLTPRGLPVADAIAAEFLSDPV